VFGFIDIAGGGTFFKYYDQGGPVMNVLLLFSILGLIFIIERFWVLQRARIKTEVFLDKIRNTLLKKQNIQEAIKVCEQNKRSPIANILKAGLLKHGHAEDEIEKSIQIAVTYELARLERGLPVIATVANVAPLTGFLGTVTGMIKSFDELARAGLNNPGAVAAGISEALITTATGLIIAIPTLMCYNWFTAKISRFILEMETGSNILLETFVEMESKSKA